MQKPENDRPVKVDTLSWGQGPHLFEVFLEPTCPYSVKAFLKFDALLAEAGEDRITLIIRLQSQPWHMFSGVIIRCILAAATLEGGKENAKNVMAAVAAHRREFEFDNHAEGPNLDVTPKDIIKRLEHYSGIKLAEAFAIPTLDQAIKWQCKYARQNGVHVSPTFMINGIIRPNMSSGDSVSSWIEQLN
ncbi:thioredoxin domain-containing protein [Pseudomonas sp. W4I3]|uniref:DsbA family protein n=1 Tax=Pseudomonas sp. W4I3 TaxID=3042294 RepID=UPI00278A0E3C|nr:thioredoxin domain-containing protein [Pseudomonas sp. W4I3]MDQ0741230.1 protein-disulfide isomerase [Pseudomonas sp. W4I3]